MLREVLPSDLDIFFAQQLDPVAIRMAAFVTDRSNRQVFDAHWAKILQAPKTTNRTIVAGGQIAGYVACFPLGDDMAVAYWLGREFWGHGLATAALQQMLQLVTHRPLVASVAVGNIGSLKVLQKCGFKITGKDKGFAAGLGRESEEYLLRLN